MSDDTAKNHQNQFPPCIHAFAGSIEILEKQRRLGIPPTEGSLARIVRLGNFILGAFLLLQAMRRGPANRDWDIYFLRSCGVAP